MKTRNFAQFIFPFRSQERSWRELKLRSIANPITGEFHSLAYFRQKFPELSEAKARALFETAHSTMEKNNLDERSHVRLRIASLALVSHIFLIQLITGISTSELREIKYSDLVDSRSGNLIGELSSVKRRAAGKKTRYPLGSKNGRKILQSYLRLREWVLNGQKSRYAFIQMGRDGSYTKTVKQIDSSFSDSGHERLMAIFENFDVPYIGPSLARKYKSLVFHELNTPNGITSALLNHKISTNAIYYAETTNDRSENELSRYWTSVRAYASRLIESDKTSYESASSTGAGRCKNFDSPTPALASPSINPDCSKQFGCLYCEQYLFHADKEDLHKLLSLQYVIAEIRQNFADISYSTTVLQDLDVRIAQIIDQAASLSPKLREIVLDMKRRVFERGELTVFWENLLTRLEMIWGRSS